MNKKVVLFVVLFAMISSVGVSTAISNVMGTLEPFVGVYNQEVADQLPSYVQPLIANQRISGLVYHQDPLGNNPYQISYGGVDMSCYAVTRVGVVTDGNGRIITLFEGGLENPTMFISTTDTTMEQILYSDCPACDLLITMANGKIYLTGKSLYAKAQVVTINGLVRMFGGAYC